MSLNGPVDQLLCFGEAAIASVAGLPDIIHVGKSQTEQMKAEILCTETVAGGTSVTLTLQGSDNGSSFAAVGSSVVVPASELKKGNSFSLYIPKGKNFAYYKVVFEKSGTFSAGKLKGYIDPYKTI